MPEVVGHLSPFVKIFRPPVDFSAIQVAGFLNKKGPHGGNLYKSPAGTFEVYGAILEKYLAFGGPHSVLGRPITDETGTPDGVGRYNHFQGGSIYWTPSSGAHVVYGAIRDRWEAIGWEQSYLGYPLSDEEAFDEGGRVSQFQGGQVYWWPDTGAIDLNQVLVHYTGLVCFGETDWDMGSDADEPYAIFGVLSPTGGVAISTRVYDDVDGGESRPDLIELFRGKPGGLAISTRVMEHDEGDPNKYLGEVKTGVGIAATAITAAVTLIPVVGPILGVAVGTGLAAAKDSIAQAVSDAFGFGDDTIGDSTITLSAKQMVVLSARTGNTGYKGIGFKAESGLIRGDGASYKTYFGLVTV
ncbi:LGFP repeat-containing protein [Microbacterium sp. P5_E9]